MATMSGWNLVVQGPKGTHAYLTIVRCLTNLWFHKVNDFCFGFKADLWAYNWWEESRNKSVHEILLFRTKNRTVLFSSREQYHLTEFNISKLSKLSIRREEVCVPEERSSWNSWCLRLLLSYGKFSPHPLCFVFLSFFFLLHFHWVVKKILCGSASIMTRGLSLYNGWPCKK